MTSKSLNTLVSDAPVNQSNYDSDNIDMSELENIANKKKVRVEESHVSVALSEINKASEQPEYTPQNTPGPIGTPTPRSRSTSDSSRSRVKNPRSRARRENDTIETRDTKAGLLYKLHVFTEKKNSSIYNVAKLSMENTLDEINSEFIRVKTIVENEKMVQFSKRAILMGIQGVEMLNNTFDPLGIDLNGWGEAMDYSMQNQDYDEVLSELCEKYKGIGKMSPELKLVFMIAMSGFMFTASKKIAQVDTSNMFSNILSNFATKTAVPPPSPQAYPYPYQSQGQGQDASEDSDQMPSKMNPVPLGTDELKDIIKTMNYNKIRKEQEQYVQANLDPVKQIPILKKKGRARKMTLV